MMPEEQREWSDEEYVPWDESNGFPDDYEEDKEEDDEC